MDRDANLPLKMPTPWASGAKTGFVRQVPNQSQIQIKDGVASFIDGFPEKTFTPVANGGIPPFGADMNGILKQITEWSRWHQAGGQVRFDATFQAAIAGYPLEARVGSVTIPYLVWQSTTNNNLSNPDTGGGGWQTPIFPDPGGAVPFGGLAVVAATQTTPAMIRFLGNTNLPANNSAILKPKKWIRVWNGTFAIVNNDYNAEIFTLNDTGDISNIRNITSSGDITSANVIANTSATVNGPLTSSAVHITGLPTSVLTPPLFNGYCLMVDGMAQFRDKIIAGGWGVKYINLGSTAINWIGFIWNDPGLDLYVDGQKKGTLGAGGGGGTTPTLPTYPFQGNWANVSGTRKFNTTYHNTLSRPMMVCVTVPDLFGIEAVAYFIVNGSVIIQTVIESGHLSSFTCVVPAGASYSVNCEGLSDVGQNGWNEMT